MTACQLVCPSHLYQRQGQISATGVVTNTELHLNTFNASITLNKTVRMMPSPLELECWWLTRGQASLRELLRTQDIDLAASDAAKNIRNLLEDFENSVETREEVGDTISVIRQQLSLEIASLNPRKKLATARRQIFRDEGNGGLCIERISEGLTFIDDVERHRALLVSLTVSQQPERGCASDKLAILEALNNASRLHFEQCYIGLRIHVSNKCAQALADLTRTRAS